MTETLENELRNKIDDLNNQLIERKHYCTKLEDENRELSASVDKCMEALTRQRGEINALTSCIKILAEELAISMERRKRLWQMKL